MLDRVISETESVPSITAEELDEMLAAADKAKLKA